MLTEIRLFARTISELSGTSQSMKSIRTLWRLFPTEKFLLRKRNSHVHSHTFSPVIKNPNRIPWRPFFSLCVNEFHLGLSNKRLPKAREDLEIRLGQGQHYRNPMHGHVTERSLVRRVLKRLSKGPGMLMVVMIAGCASVSNPQPLSSKIDVDLGSVNSEGLRGPPDGLRAVHYEFCITAREDRADEVRSIDPTAQLMPGSRGRIGCARDQILVVGSTQQRSYRQVLERLAALEYVNRIGENVFE